MNLTEIDCELSSEQEKFVDYLLSVNFPLYYQQSTDKYKVFSHSFVDRNKNYNDSEGIVNSPYWESVHKFFKEICTKYNIEFNIIYRCALNVSTFNTDKMGLFHTDHDFPHKNFLIYLNDFSDGSTYIYDEETDKIKEVKAKKFKAVIFDGLPHAQGFCGNGERRVVLVVTYK